MPASYEEVWGMMELAERRLATSEGLRTGLVAEVERLRLWIRRIDNINDNPARFSKEIDEACIDALAGKPMTGLITVGQITFEAPKHPAYRSGKDPE